MAFKFTFGPTTGGKLTESTVFKMPQEASWHEEVAVFGIALLFFHAKNDCCSLDGTCKDRKVDMRSWTKL
jgi:hypothetical protein